MKTKKRKPQPWHLTSAEIAVVKQMSREHLIEAYIAQREQVKRVVRAIVKLKQAITELQAAGE